MKSRQWKYSILSKLTGWIILAASACMSFAFLMGIGFLQANQFYTEPFKEAEKNVMLSSTSIYRDSMTALNDAANENTKYITAVTEAKNIGFKIVNSQDEIVFEDHSFTNDLLEVSYTSSVYLDNTPASEGYDQYKITTYINGSFPKQDQYAVWDRLSQSLYKMRSSIYYYAAGTGLIALLALIYLIRAAGHTTADEEVHTGPLNVIPSDICILLYFICGAIVAACFESLVISIGRNDGIAVIFLLISCFFIEGCLTTACILNASVRIKKKEFWRHAVLWIIPRNIYRIICRAGTVWKTSLLLIVWIIFDFMVMRSVYKGEIFFYFLKTLIFICAGLWIAEMLKSLLKGTEALSKGNLSYQIDTAKMKGDFAIAGSNLNHIAVGMSNAVEERMKSERMKTELITNVSHDIKTPLTSIINYSDLLAKEADQPEKVKEYTEVLTRQSVRLKKLIEDLIEASKASTGNLEVLLAPCDANVILLQAAGEYEAKMKEHNLELVVSQPDRPVMIMADGRRLWRVFDNLLNNICKYAQEGTRVYLNLTETSAGAEISFKNTSRQQLNITADELKERFVRGDSSRNTEGNGLGLSIAQSLTELQQGTMELCVDGDLFKVTLKFPMISE